ncbi:hypothetical protein ACIO3S_06385 [Nocardioides sp. NPDC087217]|uniref:hypothetical protein n=1 Tax=Nocardioides sp. NPDC087217 TaxID=3364335 RepID=UPI003809818C
MATDERFSAAWFLGQYTQIERPIPGPGDWGRLSLDAFVANRMPSARSSVSEGTIRMSGPEVLENAADLGAVGAIASAWQRVVSAAGAGLERIKTTRGNLPTHILQRTALALNASPQPGSVVFNIIPKTSPLPEVEPDGNTPMVNAERPLADRASEQVIRLLGLAEVEDVVFQDELSAQLQQLGPRVGGALKGLAQTLDRTNITLDATWAEPMIPSLRATVNPSTARWLAQFVDGRGLNSEAVEMTGVLRTISDRERWLVEVGDEDLRMNASELDPSVASTWNVKDEVRLTVRVAVTERPDGLTKRTMTILHVAPASESEPDA